MILTIVFAISVLSLTFSGVKLIRLLNSMQGDTKGLKKDIAKLRIEQKDIRRRCTLATDELLKRNVSPLGQRQLSLTSVNKGRR